jgi:hypothetical protein
LEEREGLNDMEEREGINNTEILVGKTVDVNDEHRRAFGENGSDAPKFFPAVVEEITIGKTYTGNYYAVAKCKNARGETYDIGISWLKVVE